jgi:predicted ATPase/DNA-binding XRE family transcriptional regulator
MADKSSFGQWLKQRRKALGLTQKALAQRAGCAEISLRKIESGDLQPSASLVAALAAALDVDDADLPGLVSLARGLDDDFSTRARLLRPQRPNNLSAQLTPLIGREQDVAAVRKRLLSDGARLVTLVGPPGVGKTRLALAVAEDVLEQFEHGAFFVRLGPVSDPALVASAIAQALGIEMSGANPPELLLRAYLEEKHLLLVLDNFEQVIAAAPLVDDLLRRCPWLHVLVTSRQPLRIRGERQMPVRPLALPMVQPGASRLTGDDALRCAAVALFAERAEAVQPDFAVDDGNALVVAELCRRLDGLPLAIELVAARVKLLSPAELLQRLHGPWLLSTDGLRDVSARQRTLRGAIGWSYDLLTPVEQTLFTRLAVFVGGCTLQAAEMMCEDVLSPGQVLASIASLLDKSLLFREAGLHGEQRYFMLETVREFGLERLALSDQVETQQRQHTDCFLRIIERIEQTDADPNCVRLYGRIDDDIHNIRSALAWTEAHDVQAALLLAACVLGWQRERGLITEGRRLIHEVLALPAASAPTIPRVKMLLMAAFLLSSVNKIAEAQAYAQEGLDISRKLAYSKGKADALVRLGRIAHIGWYDQEVARSYYEAALADYRTLGDLSGICYTLVVSSELALLRGEYGEARMFAEECLTVAKLGGVSFPWPLATLATLALGEGDLNGARLLNEQRLASDRLIKSRGSLVYTLIELGKVCTLQRDFLAANAYLGEAFELGQQMGEDWLSGCNVYRAALAHAQGNYVGAIRYYRGSLEGAKEYRWVWGPCLLGLAGLAATLGQYELSARLIGVAKAGDASSYRLMLDEQDTLSRLTLADRARLGEESFDAAWNEGRTLTFQQATEEAISILEIVQFDRASSSHSVII